MRLLVLFLCGCASTLQATGPAVYVRPDVINPQEGCPQTLPDDVRAELARAGYRVVYGANEPRDFEVKVGAAWPKWGCNAQASRLEVSKDGEVKEQIEAADAAALVQKLAATPPR